MNLEALKKALIEVKESCFLTAPCREQIDLFLQNGDINIFSNEVSKELSLLYDNIILPTYKFYSYEEYIPNIFVRMQDGEDIG